MKRFFSFIIAILMVTSIDAQKGNPSKAPEAAKPDIILKVNGDELAGKVLEMGDAEVKFKYAGEDLLYSIPKQDILKITFASGRIEFFNKPPLSSEKKQEQVPSNQQPAQEPIQQQGAPQSVGLADHHNKVAVLPFGFIKNNQSAGTEMTYKAQNDVYTYLNKHSAGLTIIDPRTTNALLAKKGITRETLMSVTMDEICQILGVEYIVDGTITQNKAAQTSTSSGSVNANTQYKSDKDKTTVTGYNSTASYQYYATHVEINIFTDKNANIYSQNRRALLNTTDGSYDSPLEYLLKRCPLYRK